MKGRHADLAARLAAKAGSTPGEIIGRALERFAAIETRGEDDPAGSDREGSGGVRDGAGRPTGVTAAELQKAAAAAVDEPDPRELDGGRGAPGASERATNPLAIKPSLKAWATTPTPNDEDDAKEKRLAKQRQIATRGRAQR